MDAYEIVITPDAESDLWELRNYIADVLMAPDTAISYIRSIRREIAALSELPARYKSVDEEPWHSRGIRNMISNNFYVYYRIDESVRRVYILNVIYFRRDQLRALVHMRMD